MEQQLYTVLNQPFNFKQAKQANIGVVLPTATAATVAAAPRVDTVAQPGWMYFAVKRLIDIVGALFGLIVLAPLFLLVGIMVAIDSPGGVFHRRRVLAHQNYTDGVPQGFDAFKFRTMLPNADEILKQNPDLMRAYEKDFKLKIDPRVTRIGDRLRRTSIDELPQLWNVLMGQMTLVGPRMISPKELAMYGPHAAKLLSVKPGMTGLWQVSGRQHISYPERVRLDMCYIDNRSTLMDLQILLRTVGCVVAGRGAC